MITKESLIHYLNTQVAKRNCAINEIKHTLSDDLRFDCIKTLELHTEILLLRELICDIHNGECEPTVIKVNKLRVQYKGIMWA
jgi:hypothetical protein